MSVRHLSGLLALGLLLLAAPSSAFACKPAPNFTFDRVSHELPDCVTLNSYGSHSDLPLELNNQCDAALFVTVIDCPRCAVDTLEVGPTDDPDELVRFVLEPAEPMDQTATYRHELGWELGDDSGTIDVQASYRDNSDACSGIVGCGTSGSNPSSVWLIALTLVFLAPRRRARR